MELQYQFIIAFNLLSYRNRLNQIFSFGLRARILMDLWKNGC